MDRLQEQDLPPHLLSITITYFLRIARRARSRNRDQRSLRALTAPAVSLGHESIAARATDILVWGALHGTSSLLCRGDERARIAGPRANRGDGRSAPTGSRPAPCGLPPGSSAVRPGAGGRGGTHPHRGSDTRIAGRMLSEPLRDTRHALLEAAGAETLSTPARSGPRFSKSSVTLPGTTTNEPVLASIHSMPTSTLMVPART